MKEDLNALAQEVLSHYRLTPKAIKLIQGEAMKVVWHLNTASGPLCLKRLRYPLEKMHFSIAAQSYLAKHGAHVAPIIPTVRGKDHVEWQGQIFVMYKWIPGRSVVMERPADLEAGIKGIAAFHRASAGFKPPKCKISSKLGSWPDHYQSLHNRLKTWQQVAAKHPKVQGHRAYLQNVSTALGLIEEAQKRLEHSVYHNWSKDLEKTKCLCHQDYGDGNALITPSGVCVLDLDNVTFELPICDLRKIIVKRMVDRGHWDRKFLLDMVHWYDQANPLTAEQKQVLYIDLLFPHEFHGVVKNYYLKNEKTNAAEIKQVTALELNKKKILAPLLK